MDDYIKNIAKKLISEEIDKRIFDIENKIFENKDMKKQMCEQCGGKMYEDVCNHVEVCTKEIFKN